MRVPPRAALLLCLGIVPACGGGGVDGGSGDGGSGGGGGAVGWFSHHTTARYDDVPLINGGIANTVCSAVVDENDDGVPDLVGVVGTSPSGGSFGGFYLPHVVTRFGLGGGFFTTEWVVGWAPWTFDHRWGVAGDFDEDGLLDLAVTDAIDQGVRAVLLLEVSGDRYWVPQAPTAVGGVPGRVEVGDWDEDGHLDVAVLVPAAQRVRVLFGDGEGSFAHRTFPNELPLATGADPRDLVAADVDGDGDLDLLTADTGAAQLSVFHNHGRLGFAAGTPIPVAGGPRAIAAADLTGDGTLDLAVACSTADEVAILQGTVSGDFVALSPIVLAAGGEPMDVVALDVDGDGALDLAFLLRVSHVVGLRRNAGGGIFVNPVQPQFTTSSAQLVQLESADVTGDGRPDLLVTTGGAPYATFVYRNIALQAGP